MRRVVLHVDRLVLRGMERGDAAAVSAGLQAGLRTELQALLAGDGALAALLAAHDAPPAVQASKVRVPQGGGAAAAGRAVAARILRGASR